jgi:hypothetical protein
MTDHHDFHFDDDFSGGELHHDDQSPFDDPLPDHLDHFDDFGHDPHADTPLDTHLDTHVDTHLEEHHVPTAADDHLVADDHDTVAPHDDDLFPPPVDVGELPEPVDGFPWTDAATLGTPDIGTPDIGTPDIGTHDDPQPVDPHELAEYAGTEIPPGADPWTVLADSDDPATSTLARFWHDTGE